MNPSFKNAFSPMFEPHFTIYVDKITNSKKQLKIES